MELLRMSSDEIQKQGHAVAESVSDFKYEDGEDSIQPQKGGTQADVHDMTRLGKKQELRVRRALSVSLVDFPRKLMTISA